MNARLAFGGLLLLGLADLGLMNFKLGPELAEEQAKQAMGKQPEGKGSAGPAVSPSPVRTTPSVAVAPTPAPTPVPVPPSAATPEPSATVAAVDTAPTAKEPSTPPVVASGDKPGAVEDIQFEMDSNLLTFKAKEILDDVVKKLKANSSLKVHLRGHSDPLGSREHNLDLSRRRAAAVENFLLANGIAHSRMTIEAVGSAKPSDDSNTPTAWARNRRVEIEWR